MVNIHIEFTVLAGAEGVKSVEGNGEIHFALVTTSAGNKAINKAVSFFFVKSESVFGFIY